MRYLLAVNALVAHGQVGDRFRHDTGFEMQTCAIAEPGFVRVLSQAAQYGLTVAPGRTLPMKLRGQSIVRFGFIADDHDIALLPAWAKTARQTTAGHLPP